MLPLKWKIFRLVCYVHIAGVCFSLALSIIYNWSRMFSNAYNFLNFLLFFSFMSVLLANTFINTWLLERYYPDRRPGRALNIWHIILFILFIIIICLLTIASFAQFFDLFFDENKDEISQSSLMYWMLLALIAFTGLSICYFQISLRRTLRRNHQREIDSFLNT